MAQPNTSMQRFSIPVLWGLLVVMALAAYALLEHQRLIRELTVQSADLHRLASQRADQHDAHLTALSAIFAAGGAERQDLFLEVASTITQFYPRVVAAHVVPFDLTTSGIDSGPDLSDQDAQLIRDLGALSTGQVLIAQAEADGDHYWVVKRTPSSETATHALALLINASDLITSEAAFWDRPSATRRLTTPEGGLLTGQPSNTGTAIVATLGSRSQPLVLETELTISRADILPLERTLWVTALASAVFMVAVSIVRQRRGRRDAERSAALSAQETRLAHASRVNAMGEMASGMAHELAQPLTAILSQAQAGRHLARRGDIARLESVLDDTVSQAQRAADILDRLRRWSKPNRSDLKACSLNDAVENVQRLLAREIEAREISVDMVLYETPLLIDADPVELEQIIFNLMRNALEAPGAAQVVITTQRKNSLAIVEISDDGQGISEALRPRIFEPFVTDKPTGTGLGLALCQRLAEEVDGEIILLPNAMDTTFRVSFPLVMEAEKQ